MDQRNYTTLPGPACNSGHRLTHMRNLPWNFYCRHESTPDSELCIYNYPSTTEMFKGPSKQTLICCERKTLLDGYWFCWYAQTNKVDLRDQSWLSRLALN